MKKCPYCAEEIQDAAIVCRHCGRALAPLPSNPAPLAPAAVPTNPGLSLAMQKYLQKGYRLVSAAGDKAVLERPAAEFNSCLFGWLFFLFGVGSLVYVFIYFVWAIRKAYQVQLNATAGGQVQELGGTLEEFERDRLQAHRKRCIGFGSFLVILGGLVALLLILVLATGPSGSTTWGEHILYSLVFLLFFGLPTLGPGAFLLWRAARLREKLHLSPV